MSDANIMEMGVIDMLKFVLGNEPFKINEPSEYPKTGESREGVITSIYARRLFTLNSALTKYIDELIRSHNRLHINDNLDKRSDHDCKATKVKVSRLQNRMNVINSLFWQAVREEYPNASTNAAGVRKGWVLVGLARFEWRSVVPVSDRSKIANNLIDKIRAIINGESVSLYEDFEPALVSEEVIGTVEDSRIKSLGGLVGEVRCEFLRQMPEGILEKFDELVEKMTPAELDRFSTIKVHYKRLMNLTTSFFWCAVLDAIPAIADVENIGMRKGYKVVKSASKEGSEEVGINQNPPNLILLLRSELI